MRNRAKCKLCKDVIESTHGHDYVTCNCGEISVDGGNNFYKCRAKNWINFIRIDDAENEIIIKTVDADQVSAVPEVLENISAPSKPTREELLQMFDDFIKRLEELPPQALSTSISHYDWLSMMLLLSSIFRAGDKS